MITFEECCKGKDDPITLQELENIDDVFIFQQDGKCFCYLTESLYTWVYGDMDIMTIEEATNPRNNQNPLNRQPLDNNTLIRLAKKINPGLGDEEEKEIELEDLFDMMDTETAGPHILDLHSKGKINNDLLKGVLSNFASMGYVDGLEYAFEDAGITVEEFRVDNNEILQEAVDSNQLDVIQFLVEDVGLTKEDVKDVLWLIKDNNNREIIQYLNDELGMEIN